MPKILAANEAKFDSFHLEFSDLAESLRKLAWSKDWNIEAKLFGQPKIRGASIRMWKKDWPEEIHFESWIGNADIKRGSASLAFHIETKLDKFGVARNELNRILLEQGAKIMKGWEGFSKTPKSFQTFKCHVPFDQGKIAKTLKPEFNRLHRLGKIIDNALNL